MTEAQVIACGSCGKRMKIPPTHFGKKIKCPACASVLQIAADGSGATVVAAGQAAPPQAAPPQAAPPRAAAPGQRPATGKVPPQAGRPATGKVPPQAGRPATGKVPPQSGRPAAAAAAAPPKAKAAAPKSKREKPAKKERLGKGKLVKPKGNLAGKGELSGVAREVHKDEHVDPKFAKAGAALKKRSVKGRLEAQEKSEGGFNKLVMVFVALIVLVGGGVVVANMLGIFGPQGAEQTVPPPIPILPGKGEIGSADVRQVPNPFAPPGESDTIEANYFKRDTDEMEFVFVKGGTYKVGTNERTLDNLATPEVEVTVGDFYISRYEVTIAQYRKFTNWITQFQRKRAEIERMINNQGELLERRGQQDVLDALKADLDKYDPGMFDHPLQPKGKSHDQSDALLNLDVSADAPMYQIDWWDAYAYCNWANAMNYARGTLPTDIEWEIAARAVGPDKSTQGGLLPWSGSEEVEALSDEERLRHYGKFNAEGTAMQFPSPVGGPHRDKQTNEEFYKRCANAWGIYDMWGNVGEWVYDCWDPDLYRNATGKDYFVSLDKAEAMNGDDFDPTWTERAYRTYGFRSLERIGMDLNNYAVRGGRAPRIDEKEFDKFLGFRCVYYEDRDAPYTAELKKLYDAKAASSGSSSESASTEGNEDSNERHAPSTATPFSPAALRRRDGQEELEAAGL